MTKPRVLFLCKGNSCRSQMGEGFARHYHGDKLEAVSAGVDPHGMNRLAIRAMGEAGVDISGGRSKHVGEASDPPLDLVVTVCGHAAETCPVFPGNARVIHVPFDDPPMLAAGAASDEEAMPHYRRVRDEIRAWVEADLPGELGL